MKLIQHAGSHIVIEGSDGPKQIHNLKVGYFKKLNALLVEEVQRWHCDDREHRLSRPVLRRLHWPLGGWRLG
ncbi:hypothetical protein [Deinococcus sp.]|uniref:hypothetical protein n=1 Tax=Deinococcus sp. TaxID=47478 RepID=UPI0025C71096|nr:hypothetical protein [Deinococcus sp.]